MDKEELQGLAQMIAGPNDFMVGDKKYTVRALKLKEIEGFMKKGLYVTDNVIFNIGNANREKPLDECMQQLATATDGQPLTLEKAFDDGWDIDDLQRFLKKVLRISG